MKRDRWESKGGTREREMGARRWEMSVRRRVKEQGSWKQWEKCQCTGVGVGGTGKREGVAGVLLEVREFNIHTVGLEVI